MPLAPKDLLFSWVFQPPPSPNNGGQKPVGKHHWCRAQNLCHKHGVGSSRCFCCYCFPFAPFPFPLRIVWSDNDELLALKDLRLPLGASLGLVSWGREGGGKVGVCVSQWLVACAANVLPWTGGVHPQSKSTISSSAQPCHHNPPRLTLHACLPPTCP